MPWGLVAQARWYDPTRIRFLLCGDRTEEKRPVCSTFSLPRLASAHELLQARLGRCDLYLSPLALQASLSPISATAVANASTYATPIRHRI
jgi:hypothetical protein